MTKANKGYTLVELLLTIAIFSIVMVGVTSMMNTSSKSYQKGVFEAQNQEEVQIVTNQLEELLVDATSNINYYIYDDVDSTKYKCYKFNDDASKSHTMEIMYDELAGKLYLKPSDGEKELLADNVEFFEIDGIANKDNVCKLTLKIKNQDQVFDSTKNVTFRNNVENNISKDLLQNNIDTSVTTTNTESEFKDVLTVDRGETINLSAKYGITEGYSLSKDAEKYFILDTTSKKAFDKPVYQLKLKDNYNTPADFGISVKDNKVYLADSSGSNKIKLEVDPVVVYLNDPAKAQTDHNGGYASYTDKGVLLITPDNVNENTGGNTTYINVKGINVQEFLNIGGSVSYDIIYSAEGQSNTCTMSGSLSKVDESKSAYKNNASVSNEINWGSVGKFQFGYGLSADQCSGGMSIVSKNDACKVINAYDGKTKLGFNLNIKFSYDGSNKTYKKYYDMQITKSQDLSRAN